MFELRKKVLQEELDNLNSIEARVLDLTARVRNLEAAIALNPQVTSEPVIKVPILDSSLDSPVLIPQVPGVSETSEATILPSVPPNSDTLIKEGTPASV